MILWASYAIVASVKKGGILVKGVKLSRFVYSVCVRFDVPPKGWLQPVAIFHIKAGDIEELFVRLDEIVRIRLERGHWREYPFMYPVNVSDGNLLLRWKRKHTA